MYSTNYVGIAMSLEGCSSFVLIYRKTVSSTVDRIQVCIQMECKRISKENRLISHHWDTSIVRIIRMRIIKGIQDSIEGHRLRNHQEKVIIAWIGLMKKGTIVIMTTQEHIRVGFKMLRVIISHRIYPNQILVPFNSVSNPQAFDSLRDLNNNN